MTLHHSYPIDFRQFQEVSWPDKIAHLTDDELNAIAMKMTVLYLAATGQLENYTTGAVVRVARYDLTPQVMEVFNRIHHLIGAIKTSPHQFINGGLHMGQYSVLFDQNLSEKRGEVILDFNYDPVHDNYSLPELLISEEEKTLYL